MGRFLVEAGRELIAPSRTGYLGTPLDGCGAIDDQADLDVARLDALGHDRAGLLAWSGGGASGNRLAARHPERVTSLGGVCRRQRQVRTSRRGSGVTTRSLVDWCTAYRVDRPLDDARMVHAVGAAIPAFR